MPATYRRRLRIEGAWLAACGVAGSAALLLTTDEAVRRPLNTVGQLTILAAVAVPLGHRAARKNVNAAEDRDIADVGDGQPTPLWIHPLIVAGLAGLVALPREVGAPGAGWDAALRVTAGCAIVGLTQAVVIERAVAAAERRNGRAYFRAEGSRGAKTVLAGVKR